MNQRKISLVIKSSKQSLRPAPNQCAAASKRIERARARSPDVNKLVDDVLLAIVKVVFPQDTGNSRMCEDVSIASLFLARGEGPVLLCTACMRPQQLSNCSMSTHDHSFSCSSTLCWT